ncbi:MAG: hypothetical protein GY861_27300, partial [bacterium]|nr:hypothetical protein [bacterium]
AAADGDAWTVDLSAYGLSANQTAGVITIVEDNDDGAFTAIETVIDNAGNAANASVNVTFAGIDNQRPVVTANGSMNISFDSNSDGIAAIGDNITFIGGTVAVNDGDNWSVNLSSIGLGAGVSAGIAQMVIADDDDNPTMVFPQSVVDNAGNPAQPVTQTQPLNIDNEAPAITSGGAINISFDQNSDGIGAIGDNLTYDGGAESTNDTITWGINWSSILGYGGIDNASSTLTLVLGITDNGTAAFNIIAMDDAGNVDNGTSNTVSIDDIAPIIALAGNVTLTLDQNNDNISAINDQITYTNGSVVAGDNDTWTVNLSHYALSGVQIPGVAVTILPDDDDGPFVANETVIDDAGNSVSGLVALTAPFLLIDNEAPVILNITSPTGLVYTVGDAVTLNANLTQTTPEINNVSANMTVLDSAFSPALLLTDTNFDTVFDGSTSGLNKNTMSPDGTYNVTVLVIDNAGNTANGSIALTLYKDKPVVHGIAITPNPTEGSAIVNVTANIVDDAAVIGAKYSIYTANGSAIVTDQALGAPVDGVWNGTNESLAFDIGGDVAGQLNGVYYIDIYGQDVNGFGFYTRQTFTIGPAIEAPIVINSGPSGVDNDGNVTLTVSTDENATCRYSTVDSAYGIMPNTFTSTGGTAHSQNITGLGDGVYQYYVRCNDTDGNMMSTSAVIQFTVAIPDDSTPPTINVDSVTTTSNSAVIQVDLNDN